MHLWLHLRLHLSSRHLLALKLFSIKISPSTRSSLFVQSHHRTDSCSWVLKTTKYELSFLDFYYFHLMSYKVLTYSGCLQVFIRKSFTALSITIYLRFSKGKELSEKYLCKQNENGTFEFWEHWKLGRNVQLYGESEKGSMKDSRRLNEGTRADPKVIYTLKCLNPSPALPLFELVSYKPVTKILVGSFSRWNLAWKTDISPSHKNGHNW